MSIEHWLKNNTFDYRDFWDMKHLIKAKEKKGLTLSVCIPTLNEEQTIGKEVVIFVSELMQRYPLIDEIAVIDSGSSDQTLEVASSFGADTYQASDILPEVGDKKGKGENLWKAIHQLSLCQTHGNHGCCCHQRAGGKVDTCSNDNLRYP